MKWLVNLGLVLLAVVLVLGLASEPNLLRYRLTLTMATPSGERSGSSVIEVAMPSSSGRGLPEASGGSPQVRGEAVFVDLGAGRNMVLLMAHGPRGEGVDAMAFLPMRAMGARWDTQHKLTGSADLTGELIPTMVSFSDLTDPASAEVVPPTDAGFVRAFGPGHRLARVTLEMVPVGVWPFNLLGLSGTPVTRGIEGKMPWVTTTKGYLSGRFACNPTIETCLDVGMFRRM